MPMGDPAGYLPRVKRARKRAGKPEYEPKAKYMPRSMRGMLPKLPNVGGASIPKPEFMDSAAPARQYLSRRRRKHR